MSNLSYGTISGGNYTISVPVTEGGRPPATPSGLIATRAVEIKDGWLGQVIVDKTIVAETTAIVGEDAAEVALEKANRRVVDAIKGLFVTTEAGA